MRLMAHCSARGDVECSIRGDRVAAATLDEFVDVLLALGAPDDLILVICTEGERGRHCIASLRSIDINDALDSEAVFFSARLDWLLEFGR